MKHQVDERFSSLSPSAWVAAAGFLLAGLVFLVRDLEPGWRLAAAAGGGYLLLKLAAIAGPQRMEFIALSRRARLLFALPWPGFDAGRLTTQLEDQSSLDRLVGGALRLTLGLVVLTVAALSVHDWDDAATWLGIAGILLVVHLGYAELLTWLVQRLGYRVRPLFDRPWASRSLAEFWTQRWNIAFVEMDRVLFLPLLRRSLSRRAAAFGVFLISGLLHELAISYPPGAGIGLPLAYFGIHAVAVLGERGILHVHRWPAWLARTWTVSLLLAPLPLLFHEAFRSALIVPLLELIGRVLI